MSILIKGQAITFKSDYINGTIKTNKLNDDLTIEFTDVRQLSAFEKQPIFKHETELDTFQLRELIDELQQIYDQAIALRVSNKLTEN